MKARAITLLLAAALVAATPASAQAPKASAKAPGLTSERGDVPIEATSSTDMFRNQRDREPYPRDFQQQPPLIPHGIKGYNITKNFNKCMDCHAWSVAKQIGATRVSETHFKTREDQTLANISPRRYFCLQCHAAQVEAPPLVKSDFVPLDTVKPQPR